MAVRLYSFGLAVLAGGCGLGLYHFDNWYETMTSAWVKICLDYAEMALMGPGMGLLVWMLVERVRLRDDRHLRALRHEHDERFVMLGRIAASVAHEMRNPLQIMRLVTEELRETVANPDADLFNRLDHSLTRLDQTVMLAYELARPKRSSGNFDGVSINLCIVVDEVVREIERRSGITPLIDHDRPSVGPFVMAREHALRIILSNLIRNALEAAAGQLITVRYQSRPAIALLIENPGCIPQELLDGEDMVPSSKPGGLGIGIAISRHLCEAMGGTITFRNQNLTAETCVTFSPQLSLPPNLMTMESDHAENSACR